MKFNKNSKFLDYLIIAVFVISLILRINTFDQEGGDHTTFKRAVSEFKKGINPYEYTVQSYQREDLKHGYAYMPTLLYIQTFLVDLNGWLKLDAPTTTLWKIPVLLADLGVGFLIYKILRKSDRSKFVILLCTTFWFFNPYFIIRYEYTNYEPLPIFLLLLSLLCLGKRDFVTGVLYALAVSLKTFPIILLSIFILKSKKKAVFLIAGALTALILSAPFIFPLNELGIYINGAFLVHGGRGIQGRPLFSFMTFYMQNIGLSFYQSEFSKAYTALAILGAQILPMFLYFRKKIDNLWALVLSSFGVYYIFTPVLNRTHLLWGLPFFALGTLEIYKHRLRNFYLSLILSFALISIYYLAWNKGLKNPLTYGGEIWIDPVYEDRPRFGLLHDLYVKSIRFKRLLFN